MLIPFFEISVDEGLLTQYLLSGVREIIGGFSGHPLQFCVEFREFLFEIELVLSSLY